MRKLKQALVFLQKGWRFARRYVKGYFQKGRYTPPAVPAISIETTNICNAKCAFCANPVMLRRKEPLEMTLFKKAVDDFARMSGTAIDFNVTIGDPLLDPLLLERARHVKQYSQFQGLGFVTTLQWLHRWEMDEFFDSGITWLAISITLSGSEKYLEFFGVDKYERALGNLVMLLEENKRRGNRINVYVDVKATNEPVEDVLTHPDFRMIAALTDQDLVASAKSRGVYVDDWGGAVTLPPYLKLRPLYPRAFRPCQLLYKGLMIYSNGNVGACSCRDFEANSELILGNLKDVSLAELWEGDKLMRIRSDWREKNKVPDICKTCRHYLY